MFPFLQPSQKDLLKWKRKLGTQNKIVVLFVSVVGWCPLLPEIKPYTYNFDNIVTGAGAALCVRRGSGACVNGKLHRSGFTILDGQKDDIKKTKAFSSFQLSSNNARPSWIDLYALGDYFKM